MARDLSRADLRLVVLACCSPLGSLAAWSEAQRHLHRTAVLLVRATGDGFSALLGGVGVAVSPGGRPTADDLEA